MSHPAQKLCAPTRRALLAVLGCIAAASVGAQPAAPAANWTPGQLGNGVRTLQYTATTALLGQPTRIKVVFMCDPLSKGQVHGALGFDLEVDGVAGLSTFSFEDFEGPDASAGAGGRRPMELIVRRSGKEPLSLKVVPSGSTPKVGSFRFGVADLSKEPKSPSRTLLRALEAADAQSLQIIITDTRKPTVKLDMTVPVAGRQADFKTLLTGLK